MLTHELLVSLSSCCAATGICTTGIFTLYLHLIREKVKTVWILFSRYGLTATGWNWFFKVCFLYQRVSSLKSIWLRVSRTLFFLENFVSCICCPNCLSNLNYICDICVLLCISLCVFLGGNIVIILMNQDSGKWHQLKEKSTTKP